MKNYIAMRHFLGALKSDHEGLSFLNSMTDPANLDFKCPRKSTRVRLLFPQN